MCTLFFGNFSADPFLTATRACDVNGAWSTPRLFIVGTLDCSLLQ